jgi:hypothetical protein
VKVSLLAANQAADRFVIALSGPLTNDHPAEPFLRELLAQENDLHLIVVNELLVRGNLPAATREVRQRLGA